MTKMSDDRDSDLICVIKFMGQDNKWREWSAKFKAVAVKRDGGMSLRKTRTLTLRRRESLHSRKG